MTELPPDAQAFLARAKQHHTAVPSGAKQRVRNSLTGAARGQSAEPIQGPLGKSLLSVGAKLSACLGGAALLAVLITRESPAPNSAAPQTGGERPPTAVVEAGHTRAPTESLQAASTSEKQQEPAAQDATAVQPASTRSDTLAAETSMLLRAEAALRLGDPAVARSALHAHRARFARGQLRQEREGLLALVACQLGEPGARDLARAFLKRAPQSPLATRLRRACASESEVAR